MFDEYFQASTNVDHLVPEALAPVPADSTGSPSSISIDQDAPFRSITQITLVTQSPVTPQGVDVDYHDCEDAHMNNDSSFCSIIKDCCSYQCALCKSTRRTLWKMSAKMSNG